MRLIEVRPCFNCGNKKVEVVHADRDLVVIGCDACNLQMPFDDTDIGDEAMRNFMVERAVAKWNSVRMAKWDPKMGPAQVDAYEKK